MNWESIVKAYYPRFYSKEDVKKFVEAEKITTEQYKGIVGEEYLVE